MVEPAFSREAFERIEARKEAQQAGRGPRAPKKPYGFRGDWEKYVKSFFAGDEGKYQAFLRGGQRLSEYLRGMRYGPETTAALGLQYGVGYGPEQLDPYFRQLREYSGTLFNLGITEQDVPNWMRGFQLGLTPEEYAYGLQKAPETEMERYLYGETDIIPPRAKAGTAPTLFGWEPVPQGSFVLPPEGKPTARRPARAPAPEPSRFPFLESQRGYPPPARWLLY